MITGRSVALQADAKLSAARALREIAQSNNVFTLSRKEVLAPSLPTIETFWLLDSAAKSTALEKAQTMVRSSVLNLDGFRSQYAMSSQAGAFQDYMFINNDDGTTSMSAQVKGMYGKVFKDALGQRSLSNVSPARMGLAHAGRGGKPERSLCFGEVVVHRYRQGPRLDARAAASKPPPPGVFNVLLDGGCGGRCDGSKGLMACVGVKEQKTSRALRATE